MSPSHKAQTAFRIDEDVLATLRAIKERDGVPISEQVRRALAAWVRQEGDVKTDRKRAATRKRP